MSGGITAVALPANVVLRGARVIDPLAGVDGVRDVWLRDGRVAAVEERVDAAGATVVELGAQHVICPGLVDLHAHLREPGGDAETVRSGAAAAAAGGFTQVVAMANTDPPVDTPARVRDAVARAAAAAPVTVLTVAAVTRRLEGRRLVDVAGCAGAGAVALGDDGRNAVTPPVLVDALRAAAGAGRVVLVHPEDEALVALFNADGAAPARAPVRPAAAEVSAVAKAIHALTRAGAGRLHLQHLSSAESLDLLRRARESGLAVTAEVTPHHLLLDAGAAAQPRTLLKVNPPLRDAADREALRAALEEGLIDAVATDHAPHTAAAKAGDYDSAAPGMIGLETAVAACLTAGVSPATLVARCTAGPWRVLGAPLREPRLRRDAPADLTLIDLAAAWTPEPETLRSRSRNTPLLGRTLRGRVVLTLAGGEVVHGDLATLGAAAAKPAHV